MRAAALAAVVLCPAIAFALTGGPSEPAASGPTALTADGLVDPFTGDFQYSLPLFELPGPQGSYPFALSYRSGIQTDQEASWVGLGWTFEPGRISRSVRGVPDDVAGEDVHTLFEQRDAVAYGVSGTAGVEVFGFSGSLPKMQVFFDSYSGFGLGLILSHSVSLSIQDNLSANIGVAADLNTQQGTTLTANVGLNVGMGQLNPSFGAAFNPRTGLESAAWGYGNVSLFAPSYVAAPPRSQHGDRGDFSIKVGGELWGVFPEGEVSGYYSRTRYSVPATRRAYGVLHLHEAQPNAQLDFVREKESPLKPRVPYLPFSVLAADSWEMATAGGPGGSFRPFRNDVPVLYDVPSSGSNVAVSLKAEAGFGATGHGGGSENLATAENESAPWLGNNFEKSASGLFSNIATNEERVYFALDAGRTTERGLQHFEAPHLVKLAGTGETAGPASGLPRVGTLSGDPEEISLSAQRRSRATVIRAVFEVDAADNRLFNQPGVVRSERARIAGFDVFGPDGTRYIFAQPAYVSREVNCSFAVDPKQAGFAAAAGQGIVSVPAGVKAKLEAWIASAGATSSCTNCGAADTTDGFISCTETPPYAHTYHLTAVLGPDYVDADATNGPSDGDLGHWVRFDYKKIPSYGFRSPYYGAHYARGYEHSYLTDDRGSFTYGEKELFVLARAATSTHQALFLTSSSDEAAAMAARCDESDAFVNMAPTGRDDARGASAAVQNPPASGSGELGAGQARLTAAFLCRRGDSVPIKSVRFEQDYQLAKGVPNNATGAGKLTLRKLWFEHGKDKSGARSPYVFDYGSTEVENPPYQLAIENSPIRRGETRADRWGYYQSCLQRPGYLGFPVEDTRCSNIDEPYTRQDEGSAQQAAAWSLRSIDTPSGARVLVDYESDDYAYVQSERAGVMVSAMNGACSPNIAPRLAASESSAKLCIDLAALDVTKLEEVMPDEDLPTSASPNEVLRAKARSLLRRLLTNAKDETTDQIAFSAELLLRPNLDKVDKMWGPVTGYFELSDEAQPWTLDGACTATACRAYLHLRPMEQTFHPLAFAGWQHLRVNQPQYGVPGVTPPNVHQASTAQLKQAAKGLVNMVLRLRDVFRNYPNQAADASWSKEARDVKLRLFHPKAAKRGGGVRVKQLRVCDWKAAAARGATCGDTEFAIGKAYQYSLEENVGGTPRRISSGVAAYEPSLGGDEISVRRAVFFDDERILAPNDPAYVEQPIGESLFPAPVVGYRRVVERTLAGSAAARWLSEHPDLPPMAVAGERVYDFYTAKEFPVRAEATAIQPKSDRDKTFIPGIGTVLDEKYAASQGYRIELNDMHGKPRRVTDYALATDGSRADGIDRQTSYFYNTSAGGRLDPVAPRLYERGVSLSGVTLGQRVEYYADMRRSSSRENNVGLAFNTDVLQIGPYPIPFPVPWPAYDKSTKESRTSVFHQVVHRTGVMTTVETRDRSFVSREDRLAFDPVTAEPVVSSRTNAFGDPVYDLQVPAYWLHPRMGPAFSSGQPQAANNLLSATAISMRSASNPLDAQPAACCEPRRVRTIEVPDVLDVSATIHGNRGSGGQESGDWGLVTESLFNRHAPALAEDAADYLVGDHAPWRPRATYRVEDTRVNAATPSPKTDGRYAHTVTVPLSSLGPDGVASFERLASTCAPRWYRTELFQRYHPRGPALQSQTPLGRQDAVLYGRRAAVVRAVAQNASYEDVGYEGFESYAAGRTLNFEDLDDGNIDFWTIFESTPVAKVPFRDFPCRLVGGSPGVPPIGGPPRYEIVCERAPEIPFGPPDWVGGGNVDPVPIDFNVRIESYLGEQILLQPRIERVELRGDAIVYVADEALPFTDREVLVSAVHERKLIAVTPKHLRETGGIGQWLRKLVGGTRKPKVQVTGSTAHTGERALAVYGSAAFLQERLKPASGTYVLSAWVSREDVDVPTFSSASSDLSKRLGVGVVVGGTIDEDGQASGGRTVLFEPAGPIIDGWQRVEGEFQYETGLALTLFFQSGDNEAVFVDDLRIHPKDAAMQTFVYEPRTLRLVARLDDNNLATRWQYAQDGQLRFAERETERGWRTVQESYTHEAEQEQ